LALVSHLVLGVPLLNLYNQTYNCQTAEVKPAYFLIVGPVGAGVTTALDTFSHFGFLQVGDVKTGQLVELFDTLKDRSPRIVFSIASEPGQGDAINELIEALPALKAKNPDLNVLYLDAPESVLIQRYLGANKPHPYEAMGLEAGVKENKSCFAAFKRLKQEFPNGYYSIDTSNVTIEELKLKIAKLLGADCHVSPITINIISFGYKHGLPKEADLVFDMRFIKNPYYDDELRPLTGLDTPIKQYVFQQPSIKTFMEQWFKMMETVIPCYHQEGKLRLAVAVGCTGGQHRSVCMAEALASHLQLHFPSYNVQITHREKAHWPTVTPALAR